MFYDDPSEASRDSRFAIGIRVWTQFGSSETSISARKLELMKYQTQNLSANRLKKGVIIQLFVVKSELLLEFVNQPNLAIT